MLGLVVGLGFFFPPKILWAVWYSVGLSSWLTLESFVMAVSCSQVEKFWYPLIEILDAKGRGNDCWIMKEVE